jgi:hypothetical protein
MHEGKVLRSVVEIQPGTGGAASTAAAAQSAGVSA